MPKLENWSTILYVDGKNDRVVLHGYVYGHPRHKDGKEVSTTEFKLCTDDGLIQTQSGTVYELGAVDPEYEKLFPDARRRLMANI